MIADQYQPIISEAHPSSGHVVLRRKLDFESIVCRQLVEITQMMDVVEALVQAIEEVVQAVLAAAHHGGRVPNAAVIAGSPAVVIVAAIGRVCPPRIRWRYEQHRSSRSSRTDYHVGQFPVQVVHR